MLSGMMPETAMRQACRRFGLLLGREAGPRRAFGDIAAVRL